MSISVIDWLREKFFSRSTSLGTADIDMTEYWQLASSLYVRELAFETAVGLVSKSIAKCEFKTFKNGKPVKGDEYYLWNIEPNKNQNSSVFMYKLIHSLYRNNEALVIGNDSGEIFVADDYEVTPLAMVDYIFTHVTVDGYEFKRVFRMSEVMYFRLNDTNVKKLVDGLHGTYGQLLEYSQKAFQKSRGQKGVLSISARAQGDANFEENLRKMMNERFKPYFESDSAVLPLTEGYSYDEQDRKTYNADSTRDIRAQVDDVFSFTGRPFGIPPVLMLGEVADPSKAVSQLLTFCIDPLTDMISEEINRRRYGKKEYLAGSKIVIDTKAIKHIDLLEVATSVDKLIASGAFCIDDIRKAVGEEPIEEDWSKKHWMTKNYEPAEQALIELGRGESAEQANVGN